MKSNSVLITIIGLAAAVLPVSRIEGASATWSGTTDATWFTTTNWSVSPAPGTGDTATFNAASANTVIDLGAGIAVKSIVFDTANAAAYTIGSGGAGAQTLYLDASGSITRNAAVTNVETVNANLTLGSAAGSEAFAITNSSTSTSLVLGGAISTAQSGTKTITVNSAGTLTASGVVSDGSGQLALAKTGTGTLVLSGANSYSGGTAVTGILNLAHNTAAGTGAVTVAGAAGNQVQLANGVNVANALTLNGGGLTSQGALHVPTGSATYSGTINITAVQNAGGHFATAAPTGILTIAGDNTITSAVPVTVRSGWVVISGAQSYTGGTSLNSTSDPVAMVQFAKTTSMPATGTVSAAGAKTTVAVSVGGIGEFTAGTGAGTIGGMLAGTGGQGGTVTLAAGSSLGLDTTNATGTVTQTGAWTSTNNVGLLKLGVGTLELKGGGTYTGAGAPTFPFVVRQGKVLLNGGTHTVNGELVIGGTFTKPNGDPGLDANLEVNTGTLNITSWLSVGRGNGTGAVSSDLIINTGAAVTAANFSGGYNAGSALNMPKGSITLNGTATFGINTNGAFQLAEGAGSNIAMTLNDSSVVTVNGAGSATNRYIGNTGATGTLTLNGTSTFTAGNSILNVGYQTGNGTLTINPGTSFTNTGEVRVGASNAGGPFASGSGTINMTGGTATVGALTLARGVNAADAMTGTLTQSGGSFTSTGTVIVGYKAGTGNLTINGGTFLMSNAAGFVQTANSTAAADTVSGTITVNSGGTLTSAGDVKIGLGGTGTGRLVIAGGTVNVGNGATKWLRVGEYDTAVSRIEISSGNLKLNNGTSLVMHLQASRSGSSIVNQTGGNITAYSDTGSTVGGAGGLDLQQTGTAASSSTYNLDGGTLTIPRVFVTANTAAGSNTRTFNFNGGTLKVASGSYPTFFNLGTGGTARANVRDLGAIIDTNGYSATVTQALDHSNVGGDAAIDGGLTKQGGGTLTLTATCTYTGPTLVNNGTLTLGAGGSINATSAITVNGVGAKFVQASGTAVTLPVTVTMGGIDGTGTIDTVTVADATANTVSAGNGGSGTLTVGTLSFYGGATVNLRANGTGMDRSIATNSLVTTGAAPIVVNVTNSTGVWTSGTIYPLITYTSYGMPDASHFALGTVPGLNPNQTAELVNTGTAIALSITGESLIWTGAQSGDWTTTPVGGSQNWSYLGSGIEFATNSPVIFDDTATRFTVNLAENLSPSGIVFSNSTNDYTLSSTGGFGLATGTLTLNGAGKVTITTNNTSTGIVAINAGTLEVSGNGSITAAASITNNAALILNPSSAQTYANPIEGTGTVTKQGATAMTLSGANTFTGNFVLNGGTLNLNSAAALGAGPGALVVNAGTLDNTSGGTITMTGNKLQTWSADVTFTGSSSLAMGNGTVTLGGSGSERTVNVAANTLGVGRISGTGYGLVKTGAGTLQLNPAANSTIDGTLTVSAGTFNIGVYDFLATGLAGSGTIGNGSATTRWLYINNAADFSFAGTLQDGGAGLLGLSKTGAGKLTIATANYNHTTTVNQGVLHLSAGTTNNTTGQMNVVGTTTGLDATLELGGVSMTCTNGANVYNSSMSIGTAAGAAGAVRLSAGSLTTSKQLAVGGGVNNANQAYGAFLQTGGTTTLGGFLAMGLGGATGGDRSVLDLSGGTFNVTTAPATIGAGANGLGIMTVRGSGVYNQTSPGTDNGLWIGEAGVGVLNVLGSATVTVANNAIQLGRNNVATASGTLNLVGGTVSATTVSKPGAAATGLLNFNGGTLKSNAASTTFLTGLSKTTVYQGGGTIDNGGFAVTIGQVLEAPAGNGVSATGLMISGGGYVGPPVVTITGDGSGATAVAEIDATGNLTGLTVTCPGSGYTYASFNLEKGGNNNTGSIEGAPSVVPNVSGGMTFSGTGTTTLTAVNTYTGNTTVNSGCTLVLADNAGLKFAPGANGVCNKVTGAGAAYFYGDFTIDLSGAAIANGNSWTLVDTTSRTFDLLAFTVVGFTETSSGIHQLVDGLNTWTFTESTGVLSLAVASPAGYTPWTVEKGLTAGVNDGPTQDPDNDGINNLLEFVLDGNPLAADASVLPAAVKTGSDLVLTFHRRDDSESEVSVIVQTSPTLTGGSWTTYATIGATDGTHYTVTEDGSNPDLITVTIPIGSGGDFFRVSATKP